MSTLTLRVEGEGKPVSFESFVASMNRALHVLHDVDRVVSTRRTPALDWTIADLAMNSPSPVATLESRPRSRRVDERIAEQVTGSFIEALATAEEGEVLPGNLSDTGLTHLKNLAGGLGKNGAAQFEATFVEQDTRARVSPKSAEHVQRLLVPKSKAIGSVIGVLEVVSLHRGYRYSVYDEVTHRAVRCEFSEDELEKVKAALGQRVMVSGILHRNEKGQPLRVDQPRLSVLPRRGDLPTTEQLVGIDPDFTGTLTTDEYVRQLRDA